MKHIGRILSVLILVSAGFFYASCDKDDGDGKSEKDRQIEMLVGTWTIQNVTYDGTADGNYTGFSISITGSPGANSVNFSTNNRPAGKVSPWPASGSFTFGTNVSSQLVRDDNVNINYAVSANSLQMTLDNYAGQAYQSRTSSVAGDWVFTFTK